MIIMMFGLPVSGKSYLSQKLKDAFEKDGKLCTIIKTVAMRDPASTIVFTVESIDETIPKTKEEKDDSYRKMLGLAREELRNGKVVILDATFHKQYRREWVYALASELQEDLKIVSCDFNPEKEIRRVLEKRHADDSTKDNILNTFEMYSLMRSQSDPLSKQELESLKIVSVRNGGLVFSNFYDEFSRMVPRVIKSG